MKIQGQSHEFIAGALDRTKCNICKYGFIEHTKAAHCEACNNMGEMNLLGTMLLCNGCLQKEYDVARNQSEKHSELYEKARETDSSIRFNGDFYNAETIPIVSVKQEIWADKELNEQQKLEKFSTFLVERYEHFARHIFELDNQKFELVSRQLAVKETIRELGSRLQNEAKERIKALDENYIPSIVKPVKVNVKPKVTKSPMEKLAEAFASMHNVSKEKAMEMIQKGKS